MKENCSPKGTQNPKVLHDFSLLPGDNCLLTGEIIFFFLLLVSCTASYEGGTFPILFLLLYLKQTKPTSLHLFNKGIFASFLK